VPGFVKEPRANHHRTIASVGLSVALGSIIAVASIAKAPADNRIDKKTAIVHITGTIWDRDAGRLHNLADELAKTTPQFMLDSIGGDILAAMRIGRLVRKLEGRTTVAARAKCHSACALIFIAGVERISVGEIGLHRPYLDTDADLLRDQLPMLYARVKDYVAEMGIGDGFVQKMMDTDSSTMALYAGKDALALIPKYDPKYEAVRIAREARQYGITVSETRQREHDAEACHGMRDKARMADCVAAKLWGLGEDGYRQRAKKASQACALSAGETKILSALPMTDRKDHALSIRRETCARNILKSQN
jgi:hypothetical protein